MHWLFWIRAIAVAVWIYSILGGLACVFFLEIPAISEISADSGIADAVFWFCFATVPLTWVCGPSLYILVSALQPDTGQRLLLAGVVVASGFAGFLASQGHLGHVWAPDTIMRVSGGIAIVLHALAVYYCFGKVRRDSQVL